MITRLLLVGTLVATFASCNPITLTFSGTGLTGTLAANTFTDAPFTFVFTSDTTLLVHPSNFLVDLSTPSGTPGTFNINNGQFTGTFMDDQAVFTHPASEDDIGIWHYNCCDWLTKGDAAFASFDLASNVSVSTGINSAIINSFFTTSGGALGFTNVNVGSMTFTETVGASAVPEPSTLVLLSLGVAGLLIGRARRNHRGKGD